MRASALVGVGAAAAVAVCSGCLIHSHNRTEYSGTYVGSATFDRVEEGKSTPEYVLATFGEPTSRSKLNDGSEVWKWCYRRTHDSSGSVFLLFGGSGHSENEGAAFVVVKDGVVTKKWRDDAKS
jgi:hypothetical protein